MFTAASLPAGLGNRVEAMRGEFGRRRDRHAWAGSFTPGRSVESCSRRTLARNKSIRSCL